MSENVRLFAALELPEDVRTALRDWAAGVAAGEPALRLLAPEALHITLVFLGWQRVDLEEEIATVIQTAARPLPALEITGAAWLPPRRPGVLVAELAPSPSLLDLQTDLLDGLVAYHEPETRPFRPHVTVARVPRGKRLDAREVSEPPRLRFRSSGLVLYRSQLGRGGARYEAIVRA